MYRVMYKDAHRYVADRDGIFYYVRRVPHDVRQHYASSRISFSLRTASHQSALRAAKSVTQRLEDYWLGLRLQQMDIPDANFRNDIVIHGFRHAMRDRLRAVSCPTEMIDQIGGWSKRSVGEGYGDGYSVLQTSQWMTRLQLNQNQERTS